MKIILSKAQWETIGEKAGWIKSAGMETVNALLQKGWAKKLPDGSYIRTYWPKDTFEQAMASNPEVKNQFDRGLIKQLPNGDYQLVEQLETTKKQ